MNYSKIRFFFFLFGLVGIMTSCSEEEDQIPYVPVNITLYLAQYNQLEPIGGTTEIKGGVNGIIIYHESEVVYRAFERTCTNEPLGSCAVKLQPGNIIALCPCCQSEFYTVFQGDVKKGPARYPLRQYHVSYNAYNNVLYISN